MSVFVKATNPHSAEEAPRFEETEVAACLNGWDERHNPPKHMVAFGLDEEQNGTEELFGTLKARQEGGGFEGAVAVDCYNQTTNYTSQAISSAASDINHTGGVINPGQAMAVRRLTPRECERLQGFADDHTLIPWRGKPADQCPDGPRYKALGNSMAVPCMAWIGKRIAAQEMFPLRYLSVCSGIEAASVAWELLGWQPAAFAEVEKFPSAVLAHHWPDVPNLGDMTQYEQWKNLGAIDLLVGGTPCQSFSVAGLRQGLRDPRGGLMLTYLEIARSLGTRWLVWENVPGVLSSHGGRDFGAFLGALGALGYGWAYRVLDAQWFGVPSAVAVCSLSDTLETGPLPQRFYLSAKACAGILRRAEKRGKELPPMLEQALRQVAGPQMSPQRCAERMEALDTPIRTSSRNLEPILCPA